MEKSSGVKLPNKIFTPRNVVVFLFEALMLVAIFGLINQPRVTVDCTDGNTFFNEYNDMFIINNTNNNVSIVYELNENVTRMDRMLHGLYIK